MPYDSATNKKPGQEIEPPEGFLETLKSWFIQDRDARADWAEEAERDFGVSAPGGNDPEWDELKAKLRADNRAAVTFNRILPVVQAVCGMEINDRKEVKYKPRTTQTTAAQPILGQTDGLPSGGAGQSIPGSDDTGPAETFSAGAEYLRDQCDAEDEESDAFQDNVICGMGWTETRVDFDSNPDGDYRKDRIDPLEMVWDCKAQKRNLVDSRRNWRVREVDKEEAKQEFGEDDLSKLDAGWARISGLNQPHDREAARNYENDNLGFDPGRKTVTMVECEYWKYETAYKAANTLTGEVAEVDKKDLKTLKANAAAAGIPIEIAKHNKKCFYTVVIGREILSHTKSQSQECFKRQAITGYRDRNAKQWVGLVRAMRDPQRWANALFSSVLNQIQTSGKGVMMEKDAVDNVQQAERDWANAAKIVWLKTGALGAHPKIKQKDQNSIPPATLDLMTFALGAFRDVTGVNVEAMGLADRQQAASLEYQRRQAASTILAPFFDGMRRYRKMDGRLTLDLMRKYLADGRLVRVVGPDYERYVPLIQDDDTIEYDIIVDEAPSSPNQKESTWLVLQQMLPVLAKSAGPSTIAAYLKASPLPESIVNEIKQASEKEAANQGPSPEQMQMEMQQQQMQFDMALNQQKAEQDGVKAQADITLKGMDLQIEGERLKQMQLKTVGDLQMRQMDIAGAKEQRGHENMMRQMEMDADMEKEGMKTFSKDLPSLIQQLAQSQEQAMQSQEQLAQAILAMAQGQQQLAAALLAPKTVQMAPDGMSGTVMVQ